MSSDTKATWESSGAQKRHQTGAQTGQRWIIRVCLFICKEPIINVNVWSQRASAALVCTQVAWWDFCLCMQSIRSVSHWDESSWVLDVFAKLRCRCFPSPKSPNALVHSGQIWSLLQSHPLQTDEMLSDEVENHKKAHVWKHTSWCPASGWMHPDTPTHLAIDDHVYRALLNDVPRGALLSLVEHWKIKTHTQISDIYI